MRADQYLHLQQQKAQLAGRPFNPAVAHQRYHELAVAKKQADAEAVRARAEQLPAIEAAAEQAEAKRRKMIGKAWYMRRH